MMKNFGIGFIIGFIISYIIVKPIVYLVTKIILLFTIKDRKYPR